jgi:hypothetical protein
MLYKKLGIKRKGGALRGRDGTYVVPGQGVYKHEGGAKKGKVLYAFARSVSIRRGLRFIEIARSVTGAVFEPLLRAEAVATVNRNMGKLVTASAVGAVGALFSGGGRKVIGYDEGGDSE